MRQRIDYIDLAKGFCILLVILHHIKNPINQTDVDRVLTCFRMPLYFFLSGLFFKRYTGFINFTIRKINKLLVPFFFFMAISCIIYFIGWAIMGHSNYILQFSQNITKDLQNDLLYINIPLWFLISLFETSLIFYLISIICNKLSTRVRARKVLMAMMCFSIGIIGYELGIHKINIPLWIDTSMTAIPFFYTGYFIKNETDFLLPNRFDKYIPFLLAFFGSITYFLADFIDMMANKYNGNYFSFYTSAISGTLFILLLSKLIKKIPIISFLGRYSIIVLGTHWIIIVMLNRLAFLFTNNWLWITSEVVLIVFISIYIINFFLKFFPKFVCQEDLIKVGSQVSTIQCKS